MYTQHIDRMLCNALDCGIAECDFWNMTIGEVNRSVESYNRRKKEEAREKANLDYTLALLVGRAMSCTMSKEATFPEIYEAYPSLFDAQQIEEERQAARDTASAIRFKLFADSFNSTHKGGQKVNE